MVDMVLKSDVVTFLSSSFPAAFSDSALCKGIHIDSIRNCKDVMKTLAATTFASDIQSNHFMTIEKSSSHTLGPWQWGL